MPSSVEILGKTMCGGWGGGHNFTHWKNNLKIEFTVVLIYFYKEEKNLEFTNSLL